MSTRSSISAPGSLDLLSYSEVLHWATEKTRPTSRIRNCFLTVYRWNTRIERTGNFNLTLSSMKSALDLLVLRFDDMPHGLRFEITSWTVSNTFPIVTTTSINGLLTFRFTPIKGERLKLQIAMRRSEVPKLLLKSVFGSERRALGNRMTSVLGATGSKHAPRLNPETRQVKSTVTNCDIGGCTTAFQMFEVYRRTYSSVNTPGFITKRRNGQLPVNPYTMSCVDIRPGSLDNSQILTNGTFFTSSYDVNRLLTQSDIATGHLVVDENLLISKIRGRISATANISEDLATMSQTTRLLTVNLLRFRQFLSLVTLGDPRGLSRFLGSARGNNVIVRAVSLMRKGGLSGTQLLSRLWLEYRYGWLPLIHDVQQSLTAFQQYAGKNSDVSRVSGKRSVTSDTVRSVIYASNPGSSTKRTRYYYENAKTTCRMGLYYKMDQKMLATLSGLGLTSPVSLAWELVPYSFVVDWFLPIGPALNAFSAFEGLTFVRGYKTYYTERTVFLNIDQTYSNSDATWTDKGKSFGKRITVNRTALTAFPGPVKPVLKNPYSFIHAANAAALIVLLLSGKRK